MIFKSTTTPLVLRNRLSATIIVGAVVAIALLTVVAGISSHVDPRLAPLAGCINLAYPVLLITNVVTTIIVAFVSRKLACVGLSALLLTFSSALDYCPLNFGKSAVNEITTATSNDTFTLMSFNTANLFPYKSKFEPDEINPTIEYIIQQAPDIAVLQEVRVLKKSKYMHITEDQAERLNTLYPYILSGVKDDCILAVLSKFPLEAIENHIYNDKTGQTQIVEVTLPGDRKMTIVNLHLQSLGLTNDDKELYTDVIKANVDQNELTKLRGSLYNKLADAFIKRAYQADGIRQKILTDNRIQQNLIVTGDFNDTQNCWALRHICDDTDLKSVYRDIGFGPLITYYANHFYFRIDHTLYRGDLTPLSYICDQNFKKSDHYPTFITFKINPK